MSKKIIQIDREKCVGCGLCVNACQQSAIALVDGKAMMIHDDYCDGLGNCLPVCPVDAISFSDQDVVAKPKVAPAFTCPGTMAKSMPQQAPTHTADVPSHLTQWPVQIKLVGEAAPYFQNCHLLIAADCTAFAYGNFHQDFMKDKVTIIGCPKLDEGSYIEKLTNILTHNQIQSVTVARMEVPCCGGLEQAAASALKQSGKDIPFTVVTISLNGTRL